MAKFPELDVSAVLGAVLRETDVMLVESVVSRMMRLEIPFTGRRCQGGPALFARIRAGKLDHLHREEAAWFSAPG